MATANAESAVRNYLAALKDPASLRDDKNVAELRKKLENSNDELERLQLRQQLNEAENPSLEQFEEAFVEHAKSWAGKAGVGEQAFLDEGVPGHVLRRAGFRVPTGRGRRRGRGRTRSRVSAEQVRAAIPKGSFTIKRLQERTGASPAVVRRVVQEEEQAGRLAVEGTDRSQTGPGRAPTLYRRK